MADKLTCNDHKVLVGAMSGKREWQLCLAGRLDESGPVVREGFLEEVVLYRDLS